MFSNIIIPFRQPKLERADMWKTTNLVPVSDKVTRTTRRDPKAAAAKGTDPFAYGTLAAPRTQYKASERTLRLAQPRETRAKFEVVAAVDKTHGGPAAAPPLATRKERRAPQVAAAAAATADVRHKPSERIVRLAQPRGVPATKFAPAAAATVSAKSRPPPPTTTAPRKNVRAAGGAGSLNHAVSDRILALSKPRVRLFV